MTKETGGPAFPQPITTVDGAIASTVEYSNADSGMTLRDWFAGMALQGLIAHHGNDGAEEGAKMTYEIADAMLKARGG